MRITDAYRAIYTRQGSQCGEEGDFIQMSENFIKSYKQIPEPFHNDGRLIFAIYFYIWVQNILFPRFPCLNEFDLPVEFTVTITDQGRAVNPRTTEHSGDKDSTSELFWGWFLWSFYQEHTQKLWLLDCLFSPWNNHILIIKLTTIWSWKHQPQNIFPTSEQEI